jgi:hypothetical protein
MKELLEKSHVLVITTPWKEFQNISPDLLKNCIYIFDCWRVIKEIPPKPIRYIPFGKYIEP